MSIISDCLWEDLENISLPSLPFQLQFPDSSDSAHAQHIPVYCEDEADLLPILEQDDLEFSLNQACESLADNVNNPDNILHQHINRLELSNEISHLHVLVCGQCHLVFHFIDQFLSHTQHCHHQRHQQQSSGEDDNSSVETLAVTMWTNSVARVVDDMNTDEAPDIRKRIMHKWLSLSEGFRRCWLEAARNLIQLSNIRRYLEEEDNQDTQPSLVMDNSVASASEPTITEAPSVKRKSPKQTRNFNNVRDERGRWASNNPNPRSENEFKCETCQFETNSKWKIERHLTTRKHLDNVEAATQEDFQQTVEILDDEIEQLDKLQDEREFLYESPCDIIMEDS